MGRRRLPLSPELLAISEYLRPLAAAHGGVISAAQCRALGVEDRVIRRLISDGGWSRARHGVYRDSRFRPPDAADADHHARCAALLASLASPAVVSHTSAARLLGLPLPPGRNEARACVTRRRPAATNDPLLGDVHVTDYADADIRMVSGVPVLAGARLAVDCCADLPPDSALAITDAVLRRRLATPDDLRRELTRLRGRPGVLTASRVVERADPGAASWFESMSRWWLLEGGLPAPTLQAPFADESGEPRAWVDFWFAEHRTVGEADGAGKYDQPHALFAEKQREDWLRDTHQVEVVRWVPQEMRRPGGRAAVVSRFTRAFARRS